MYLLFSWFHRHYVLISFIISSFSRNLNILLRAQYLKEINNNSPIILDFLKPMMPAFYLESEDCKLILESIHIKIPADKALRD